MRVQLVMRKLGPFMVGGGGGCKGADRRERNRERGPLQVTVDQSERTYRFTFMCV